MRNFGISGYSWQSQYGSVYLALAMKNDKVGASG